MYNNNSCFGCLIAAGIGIILGIIVGILFFLALIPGIVTALWIAFGIAVLSLVLLTLISAFGKRDVERCVCTKGRCLLGTALGTIFTTIIALAITLTTGVVGIAILIGIVTAFFVATLVALFQFISCIISANCRCRE